MVTDRLIWIGILNYNNKTTMKKFTTEEIRDLLNQVYREEISFSRMVEVMNEMVDEKNEPQYKDGDFVVDEVGGILIFRKKVGDSIYNHAYFYEPLGVVIIAGTPTLPSIKRLATEEEKQELHDAIAKEGKRWNEEKKCVEDIPKRRFNVGDKVVLKSGYKKQDSLTYLTCFDLLIGKPLTIKGYTDIGNVCFSDCPYIFDEDWLEPYVEELKEGDLAIFWDSNKEGAFIGIYKQLTMGTIFKHKDHRGYMWKNALKFESKEQYERLIRGEI